MPGLWWDIESRTSTRVQASCPTLEPRSELSYLWSSLTCLTYISKGTRFQGRACYWRVSKKSENWKFWTSWYERLSKFGWSCRKVCWLVLFAGILSLTISIPVLMRDHLLSIEKSHSPDMRAIAWRSAIVDTLAGQVEVPRLHSTADGHELRKCWRWPPSSRWVGADFVQHVQLHLSALPAVVRTGSEVPCTGYLVSRLPRQPRTSFSVNFALIVWAYI